MKYLVDAGALTRILRRQADPAWGYFEERGLLSVAEPALSEALRTAQAKDYDFETAARFVPELKQRRLGHGSPTEKAMSAVDE